MKPNLLKIPVRSKLRIAQLAPIVERIPPKTYGGIERIVHGLTEELVRRGHQVTLFASGDSETSAKLVSVHPKALREAKDKDLYGSNSFTLLNIGLAYSMQDQFDVIHDHCQELSMPTANLAKTPVIKTIHSALSPRLKKLYETLAKPHFISISHAQTKHYPTIKIDRNIYNGLSMEHYPFGEKAGDYLLFVGRIDIEKGVHHAIDVAQMLNIPLIIAAKLDEKDHGYYKEQIEPRLSNGFVKWIGEVNEEQRNELMSKALCFLHPVTWDEPFGLTLIEAQACGCPVVAFGRGSIPEIVRNGITGYVVDDIEEMVEAVAGIGNIDRATCRAHVLENFSASKMADEYEQFFYQLAAKPARAVLAPIKKTLMPKIPSRAKISSRTDRLMPQPGISRRFSL